MLTPEDKQALRDFCRAHYRRGFEVDVARDAARIVEHEGTVLEAEAYAAEWLDQRAEERGEVRRG